MGTGLGLMIRKRIVTSRTSGEIEFTSEPGGTRFKVRLPINGKQFSLEKILALPGDPLFFDVEYSGWDETK